MKRLLDGLTALGFFSAALLSAPRVWQAAQINFWSRQFLQGAQAGAPPADHLRASYWQAAALFGAGDLAGAEALLAGRQDMPSLHLQADIFLARGDFASVAALWQQAGDAQAVLDVAFLAAQAGDSAAQDIFQTAYGLDAELGTLPLANFLLARKEYDGSERILRQALYSMPQSKSWPLWSNRLGDVLRAQNRWDEAVTAYQNTIARAADNWAAYIGIGWAKYERGDGFSTALEEFQKAIRFPESQGRGQAAIAQALTREKRFTEADAWFSQALALDPKAQWWYVARGNAARQADNLSLSLSVYQQALALFPSFAPTYYEIAQTYRLSNQPEQAIAAIEQALALMNPPNGYYYVRAGEIYEWAGDSQQALQNYRQALLLDPQNTTALDGVSRLNK